MQYRHQDASHLAVCNGHVVLVHQLDDDGFRLQVIVIILRTLRRDVTRLFTGIPVGNLRSEHRLHQISQQRRDDPAVSHYSLQRSHLRITLFSKLRQHEETVRSRNEIVGLLSHQPIKLLLDARAQVVEECRGAGSVQSGHGPSPVRSRWSIAVRFENTDLSREIPLVPKVVAQRDRVIKITLNGTFHHAHGFSGGSGAFGYPGFPKCRRQGSSVERLEMFLKVRSGQHGQTLQHLWTRRLARGPAGAGQALPPEFRTLESMGQQRMQLGVLQLPQLLRSHALRCKQLRHQIGYDRRIRAGDGRKYAA